jgi:hypothetical protein
VSAEEETAIAHVEFACDREAGDQKVPAAAVGEAIVTAVHADASIVRVTLVHDAIFSGDLIVLRRP